MDLLVFLDIWSTRRLGLGVFACKAMIPHLIFVQVEKDSVVRPKTNCRHALKCSVMHCFGCLSPMAPDAAC